MLKHEAVIHPSFKVPYNIFKHDQYHELIDSAKFDIPRQLHHAQNFQLF